MSDVVNIIERAVMATGTIARRSAKTVNPMLPSVVGLYEFDGRSGNRLAAELDATTRGRYGSYKPFLSGIAPLKPRGRQAGYRVKHLRRTLSLEQVAAVIDCQQRLRDRFLFALLASTGMRIWQGERPRHEDVGVGAAGRDRAAP